MENYISKFDGMSEEEVFSHLNGKSMDDYVIENLLEPLKLMSLDSIEYYFERALQKIRSSRDKIPVAYFLDIDSKVEFDFSFRLISATGYHINQNW